MKTLITIPLCLALNLLCGCLFVVPAYKNDNQKECTYYGFNATCLRQTYEKEETFVGIDMSLIDGQEDYVRLRKGGTYGISMSAYSHKTSVSGAQIGGWCLSERMNGGQLGGINIAFFPNGVQCAFMGNISAVQLSGVQFAPLCNVTFSVAEKISSGGQVACINSARDFKGLQCGIINFMEDGNGIQMGLFNCNFTYRETPPEKRPLQVGLLNRTSVGWWLPISNFGF